MKEYISPNEEMLFGKNDSETIQNAIFAAEEDGCRKILIPRYNARVGKNEWRIPVSIKLPSDFTVILDNCYMVQETGVYDNMFTNLYSWDLEKCTKMEYEQKNIAVIGQGNVILDGGVHNLLLEKTSGKFRQPPLRRNNMFLWINVNGLRMENLHIENQRWWAINHMFCRNVKIKDIDFFAIPHVNNMDGIDLRIGCNNFDIQNITGRTGDDVIAMTALQGKGELDVALSSSEKSVIIEVSDTGKGIPKSNWKRIFEPGYTTKTRGWGLGLSLARRIVEDYHHGRIVVARSEVGRGTTFRITLKRIFE